MKITKLTKEQESRFPEWRDKWIEIGLSTEPADFEKATEAALRAYALCNLKKPQIILRTSSPYGATYGGTLAWKLLKEFSQKKDVEQAVRQDVGQAVWQDVRQDIWQAVEQDVEQAVWQAVRQDIWQAVLQDIWQAVRQDVGQDIWQTVGQAVRQDVGQAVGQAVEQDIEQTVWQAVRQDIEQTVWQDVKDGFNNYGINSLWASWAAYISFFRDVCGWQNQILEKFSIDEDLIQSCGWTWWHQNVLAISDRPEWIKRDEQGRLHSQTGHSIHYRDGWGFSSWHGVRIPDEWLNDKNNLTPQTALQWGNIEQRRAACEILGWSDILDQLKVKIIDRNKSEYIGTLLEVDLPDSGKERFLKVKCGTGRQFCIPVPPDVKTALEGNSWTYGIKPDQLNPEVRT